jgi:23S rRNA (adenine2030-N6)-methyltransferase
MNYRHIYHAGNFADVFKHVLLTALIESLLRKNKPFCYLDTHAGIGHYDLEKKNAQKTREFENGIFKLLQEDRASLPKLITRYLQLVSAGNGGEDVRYYPGSPALVRQLLRPDDRMILTELHAVDIVSLKQLFLRDKQVAVHHLDGYQALKAFLPPKESRGLVLIDPPFEETGEFDQIMRQLQKAVDRWPVGTYAIWYPIKNTTEVNHFYKDLKKSGIREILCCEIHLPHFASKGLGACGMVVVHPPWQWKEEIESVLPVLCDILSKPDVGGYCVKWLVEE